MDYVLLRDRHRQVIGRARVVNADSLTWEARLLEVLGELKGAGFSFDWSWETALRSCIPTKRAQKAMVPWLRRVAEDAWHDGPRGKGFSLESLRAEDQASAARPSSGISVITAEARVAA